MHSHRARLATLDVLAAPSIAARSARQENSSRKMARRHAFCASPGGTSDSKAVSVVLDANTLTNEGRIKTRGACMNAKYVRSASFSCHCSHRMTANRRVTFAGRTRFFRTHRARAYAHRPTSRVPRDLIATLLMFHVPSRAQHVSSAPATRLAQIAVNPAPVFSA